MKRQSNTVDPPVRSSCIHWLLTQDLVMEREKEKTCSKSQLKWEKERKVGRCRKAVLPRKGRHSVGSVSNVGACYIPCICHVFTNSISYHRRINHHHHFFLSSSRLMCIGYSLIEIKFFVIMKKFEIVKL